MAEQATTNVERSRLARWYSKVSWGVTKVRELVDTVNQTDLVENQSGDDTVLIVFVQVDKDIVRPSIPVS